MKKFNVRGTHMEFFEQEKIEANSEAEARDIYTEKWDNEELYLTGSDLEITVEPADEG